MKNVDLKLIKDGLATQLDSYRINQFSEDIVSHYSDKKDQSIQNNQDFNNILSAKNEWEACVDSLEHQAMVILDHDLKVIRVNRTVELWGWGDVNKVRGIHILDLIKPAIEKDSVNDWCQLDIQANVEWESNNISGKKYRFTYYPNRDIDGIYHHDNGYAVLLISEITDKELLESNKYLNDRVNEVVTDEYEYEQERLKEETEKRLHLLAEQLIHSQEYERKRVSTELHDGVGQVLSALKFQVESLINGAKGTSLQRKGDVVLNSVLDNIKVALKDLRRISVDLRPSVIDDLGLLMALRWFIGEYKKVYTNINVDLQLDVHESKLSDVNKKIIYRIIQEAMNNIAKYASASIIFIQLIKSNNGLLLRISDNGCGFDLAAVKRNSSTGLGLKNMEERAESSGGQFIMSSKISSGTTVQVFWREDQGQS